MVSIVRVSRKERRVFMRHLISAIILALSVVMWTSWAWPVGQREGTLEDVIEQEVWIVFAHDPAGYLQDAWENFLNGELQEAAYNIRKAKALMRVEIYRSENGPKKELRAAVGELEKLTAAIEDGSAPTGNALKAAFAQAEYALAYHHYQKALKYEARQEYEKMTYALDAASTHSLYASVWADEDLDQKDALALKEARSIAKKVLEGSRWAPAKLREVIKSIGHGIKRLGSRFKPAEEGP
jgi:hypothetical protein